MQLGQAYIDHEQAQTALREKLVGLLAANRPTYEGDEKPQGIPYPKEFHAMLEKKLQKNSGEFTAPVMLPMKKDNWPSNYLEMNVDPQLKWPQLTGYRYTSDVLFPPYIDEKHLYFGYRPSRGQADPVRILLGSRNNYRGNYRGNCHTPAVSFRR